MAQPDFGLKVSHNKYLSASDSALDAILTVTALDIKGSDTAVAAQVILLDCSGSMSNPRTKIAAARRAAAAAIDALRDGTYFAVVQGTGESQMCYPTTPRMAVADATTRAQAKWQVNGLLASGGTAMGTWLTRARELLAAHPTAIRHAVLLTDGQNVHETSEELDRVLADCDGHFFCDARGIGDDWDPKELRRIVTVLRGAAAAVRAESDLVADFRALAEATMAKVVPDLRIRVTTLPGAELSLLKQVHPRELDFTGNPARRDGSVWEFSTGSWAANDSRDYQLSLRVNRDDRDPMGEDLLAAAVELVAQRAGTAGIEEDATGTPPEPVVVHWTSDPALSTRFDPKVAHYNGQAELTRAIMAGFDAYDAGRHADAAREWGRAVRLANESGNVENRIRLDRLVDVIDEELGIVRLKPNLSRGDLLDAAAVSDVSIRWPANKPISPSDDDSKSPQPATACPKCQRVSPGTAKFCGGCGAPLGDPGQ